jgi:hypothetical protein
MVPEKGSASEGSAAFSGDFKVVCVSRGSRWLAEKPMTKLLARKNNYQETPSQEKWINFDRETNFSLVRPLKNPIWDLFNPSRGISINHQILRFLGIMGPCLISHLIILIS